MSAGGTVITSGVDRARRPVTDAWALTLRVLLMYKNTPGLVGVSIGQIAARAGILVFPVSMVSNVFIPPACVVLLGVFIPLSVWKFSTHGH